HSSSSTKSSPSTSSTNSSSSTTGGDAVAPGGSVGVDSPPSGPASTSDSAGAASKEINSGDGRPAVVVSSSGGAHTSTIGQDDVEKSGDARDEATSDEGDT